MSLTYLASEPTDCWNWTGAITKGYGQRRIKDKLFSTHRLSWEMSYGEIPPDTDVLHRCDNRKCFNPKHLFLGTHSDNMQDMWNKGRHSKPTHRPSRKLSDSEIGEIRLLKDKISSCKLSKIYCVTAISIRNIWNGVTWKL